MPKIPKIAHDGELIESLIDLKGRMGVIYFKGIKEFNCDILIDSVSIIFTRCHTELTLYTDKKEETISINDIVIIPKLTNYKIFNKMTFFELAILIPNEQLFNDVAKTYSLANLKNDSSFSDKIILPRHNWTNEIMHRYIFERVSLKNNSSNATIFLEEELIKELYFKKHEVIGSVNKEKINMDELNLNNKNSITQRAIKYIEIALLSKKLNIDTLVNKCGTSKSTLQRVFKQDMNQAIFEYIRNRRLEEANTLLKNKSNTVSMVADMVGYEDVSSFICAFKKKFGITPSEV